MGFFVFILHKTIPTVYWQFFDRTIRSKTLKCTRLVSISGACWPYANGSCLVRPMCHTRILSTFSTGSERRKRRFFDEKKPKHLWRLYYFTQNRIRWINLSFVFFFVRALVKFSSTLCYYKNNTIRLNFWIRVGRRNEDDNDDMNSTREDLTNFFEINIRSRSVPNLRSTLFPLIKCGFISNLTKYKRTVFRFKRWQNSNDETYTRRTLG